MRKQEDVANNDGTRKEHEGTLEVEPSKHGGIIKGN